MPCRSACSRSPDQSRGEARRCVNRSSRSRLRRGWAAQRRTRSSILSEGSADPGISGCILKTQEADREEGKSKEQERAETVPELRPRCAPEQGSAHPFDGMSDRQQRGYLLKPLWQDMIKQEHLIFGFQIDRVTMQ